MHDPSDDTIKKAVAKYKNAIYCIVTGRAIIALLIFSMLYWELHIYNILYEYSYRDDGSACKYILSSGLSDMLSDI